jgi:hypothetical protein
MCQFYSLPRERRQYRAADVCKLWKRCLQTQLAALVAMFAHGSGGGTSQGVAVLREADVGRMLRYVQPGLTGGQLARCVAQARPGAYGVVHNRRGGMDVQGGDGCRNILCVAMPEVIAFCCPANPFFRFQWLSFFLCEVDNATCYSIHHALYTPGPPLT